MITTILSALKAYTNAFNLISKLKLWKYFVIPIVISVITSIIILFLSYSLADDISSFVTGLWKWEFGKSAFEVISTFLSGLLILAIGLILFKHIVMALSAPFMSPVSEKIELYIGGNPHHQHRKTSFSEQLVRGIRINIRNLAKELLFTVPILIIGLIPVIGVLSPVLLFIMQAYYAGFGNMDYTLERHYNYKESVEFVKSNKGMAVGNGMGFLLLLLVPVIGIILILPLSVTAASTQTIRKIKQTN